MEQTIEARWHRADNALTPQSETIDVWRIALRASPARQRADAHAARLTILARYLRLSADAIRLARAPDGKPYLASPCLPLQFNLSHTHGIALLAVDTCRPLGVDIERLRPIFDPLRLARRVMSARDIDSLTHCAADRRTERFIDLWTRFEARQKMMGRGVFAAPVAPEAVATIGFSAGDGLRGCVAVGIDDGPAELRFFDFDRR